MRYSLEILVSLVWNLFSFKSSIVFKAHYPIFSELDQRNIRYGFVDHSSLAYFDS